MLLTDFLVPTTHYPPDNLVLVKRIRATHKRQRGQSPIDTIHSQVLGKLIRKVLLLLEPKNRVSISEGEVGVNGAAELTLSRDWMYATCLSTSSVVDAASVDIVAA